MAGSPGKNHPFFVDMVSVMGGKRFLIFISTGSIIFLVSNFIFMGGKKLITYRYNSKF